MTDTYKWILEEIKDADAEVCPSYIAYLFSELEVTQEPIPDGFIEKAKEAISKNKAFEDIDVLEWVSGFEMSELLGLNAMYQEALDKKNKNKQIEEFD